MKKYALAFAPGSVANIGPGFDILAFAMTAPGDEVEARFSSTKGARINSIIGDQQHLPLNPLKNTATVAVNKFLAHLKTKQGIELDIRKGLPLESGLGSSAASAVAAVVATNHLLGSPIDKHALLPFALQAEMVASGALHADNVSASLLGGITLVQSLNPLNIVEIPAPTDLHYAVLHPNLKLSTKKSRAALPKNIPLKLAVQQFGSIAGLVSALIADNLSLLQHSLNDFIAEPKRAKLIPHFYAAKHAGLKKGALGVSICGSGPSIFALCNSRAKALSCGKAIGKIYSEFGIDSTLYVAQINSEGAHIL